MWFFVLFCPPLYFFFKKKIIAAIITTVLMLSATVFFFVFPPIGLFIGFIAVGWAAMDYGRGERTKFAKEQASEIAKAIAKQNKDKSS
jgi:hypothetical protein